MMKPNTERLIPFAFILFLCMDCNPPTAGDPGTAAGPTAAGNPLIVHDVIPESGPCGELAGSQYVSVALDGILCAARDSAGVLYVIDENGSRFRCFVAEGDTLHRRKVTGSSIVGEEYYFISIENVNQLIFHHQSGVWNDVYLNVGGRCDECDSILADPVNKNPREMYRESIAAGWSAVCGYLDKEKDAAYKLSVTDTTGMGNMATRNFLPTTRIEYLARQQDGHNILVTRPEYDWNGEAVVHFGMPGEMVLCECLRFIRALDGGSTWIRYLIDSTEAEAYFGVIMDTDAIKPGAAYNIIDGDTLELERVVPDADNMSALGFVCSWETE
ncbi:MAG: hypothetical protein JW863_04385 [Chitinispirillaceae bacterium]|nr:hypothetical protein [Chitinispirillaceae bacterium]